MAVLTPAQLAPSRQDFVSTLAAPTFTKTPINAALQAIEDWFESNRAAIGSAIETAAPGAFTNAQKTKLVKFYLSYKLGLE